MMPENSGLTVLRHFQQYYPSITVVMVTEQTSDQMTAQALAAGARAYLYKPFVCKEFEEVLQCTVEPAA